LREIARIECNDKIGVSLLGTCTKNFVSGVGRNAAPKAGRQCFGVITKQIDEGSNGLAPDVQPLQDSLVLRQDLF
jgi:hypothetical protein